MKKVKAVLVGISMLSVMFLCTSCGAKQMPMKVIKTAILAQDDVYSVYGLEGISISIDDENYDRTYKTEDVTADVYAESAETNYSAVYDVIGSYQDGTWIVTSVIKTSETVWPKDSLPEEIVAKEIDNLLQEKINQKYYLDNLASCIYNSGLTQNVTVDLQLCSNTEYMSTTRDCQLFYEYTLDGWELTGQTEGDVQVQITDDLCGTWVASNGEDSYTFVIDHIEGDTAYVKYQAQFRMPQYGWSSRMISRGYDTLTPVPISVVYEDWESDYYVIEIVFENSRYAEYSSEDTYDTFWSNPMSVGIRVFPDHCPEWKTKTCANGTIEDGKAYVLTAIDMSDATPPTNGTYILTKQ